MVSILLIDSYFWKILLFGLIQGSEATFSSIFNLIINECTRKPFSHPRSHRDQGPVAAPSHRVCGLHREPHLSQPYDLGSQKRGHPLPLRPRSSGYFFEPDFVLRDRVSSMAEQEGEVLAVGAGVEEDRKDEREPDFGE